MRLGLGLGEVRDRPASSRLWKATWFEAVTGRADFLVDLEAALQGAAVIGAERAFEREVHVLGRQRLVGVDARSAGADGQRGRGQSRAARGEAHGWFSLGSGRGGVAEHGLGDGGGKRLGRLDQADDRHDQPEEGEVVERGDARHPHQRDAEAAPRRRSASRNSPGARSPPRRPRRTASSAGGSGRSAPRLVSSQGMKTSVTMRAAHHDHADQLVRDRTQHRVEGQQVPFRHDVGRRHQRIGRHVIVRIAEEVRRVEHEAPRTGSTNRPR